MKILWYITKKDLLQVVRDRSALFLMLAVPLILIAAVGFAFGNIYGDGSTQISVKVALSNQDTASNAFVGKAIADALNINTKQLVITLDKYNDPVQVNKQVASSNDVVGIVVPAGASQTFLNSIEQGHTPKNIVQFYTLPNSNDSRIVIVQDIVNRVLQSQLVGSAAVHQVYQVCNQPGNHCAQNTVDTSSISAAVAQASASGDQAVQSLTAGHAVKIDAFDQVVPGYAVFFSLFGLNAVAATILLEKEDGTFRRLLIAPIQKYALLGGKLLAQFLVTLAQLCILFLVGYFVFKMHVSDWPTTILLLIGTSFAATGLGILLVSLVKTRRQINPAVTLVTLVMSAIGGAWWPIFLEPTWMQQIAKIGITAWAMEGLNGSMLLGKSFMGVLPDILGLLAYGTICFIIALRFFRFQERT
ncbi:MAG TPA: ABC transporter permease, partial [Ktedonobacteraceae bacterium]